MSKRRRSSSPAAGEGTVASSSPIVQSKAVWFEDGNIILQAENTQFKVHRGVLAKHSPVFAGLFKVPRPADEPIVDGCPVVQLTDSELDVTNILCSLYGDTDAVRRNGLLHLHVVESMVRLGKKYQIDHLYKEGLRCLKREFPKELYTQDESRRGYYFANFEYYPSDVLVALFSMIKLAQECGLQSILPALYLFTVEPCLTILYHAEAQSLSFETIRSLVCGRERILREWKHHAHKLVLDSVPSPNCTSSVRCGAIAEHLQELLRQDPPELHAVVLQWTVLTRQWIDVWQLFDEDLCKACAHEVQESHDRTNRQVLWRNLPSYFDLPAWAELKDLEA